MRMRGYISTPKAITPALGVPVLFRILDCVAASGEAVCIACSREYAPHRLEERIQKRYPELRLHFYELSHPSSGAAETVARALTDIAQRSVPDEPIMCLDCDTLYEGCDVVSVWGRRNRLMVFTEPPSVPVAPALYSYVRAGDACEVMDIAEKRRWPDGTALACTGAYGFESWKGLLEACLKVTSDAAAKDTASEPYLSHAISCMLAKGVRFDFVELPTDAFQCLGTPRQLMAYCSAVERPGGRPLRFCFDLDGTLVSVPKVHGDYSTVSPIQENVDMVRELARRGHTIIIQTARRMRTHSGCVGRVVADIGAVTMSTLERLDIPYHELHFGKPEADHYVDDRAVNSTTDLEVELGYFGVARLRTRGFHSLTERDGNILRKESSRQNGLMGEILFYDRVPGGLRHLFPAMHSHDAREYRWLEMERISGPTAGELFLKKTLAETDLVSILGALGLLHCEEPSAEERASLSLEVHANYASKLRRRYSELDYAAFPGSASLYQELHDGLSEYERECPEPRACVIHGDPVFSNIIFQVGGGVRFVDTRGMLGDRATPYGDPLYDWSKLYQSLNGYDEIGAGKAVDQAYRAGMLACFRRLFDEAARGWGGASQDEWFQRMRLVTRSLLFSLIPLHINEAGGNEKCVHYYRLAAGL